MAPLSPQALAILDGLCWMRANSPVRVKQFKCAADQMRLQKLWDAALVHHGTFEPTAWAMHDWGIRQAFPKFDETPDSADVAEPAGPREPCAEAAGGDDARKVASPPMLDLDGLLACFADDFEPLSTVARRYAGTKAQKIVRHARTLKERGLVEYDPPSSGRAFCVWRKAQTNPSAVEPSTQAEPLAVAPQAVESAIAEINPPRSALEDDRRVDIEVNIGPRRKLDEAPKPRVHTTSEGVSDIIARAREVVRPEFFDALAPPSSPISDAKMEFGRLPSASKDRNRATAIAKLDAGETPDQQSNVTMKIAMRAVMREREEQQRLVDPVEQAKTTIRRVTRKVVFGAEVSLGPKFKGQFYVGRDIMTRAELLAYAKRLAA